MGGGGKKKPFNKSKPRRRPINNNQSLFVEGGILAGFNSPLPTSSHRGNTFNSNGKSRSGISGNGSSSNSNSKSKSKGNLIKSPANAYRFDYPSVDVQEIVESESCLGDNAASNSVRSRPIILLGNKDNNIVAFEDSSPSMQAPEVEYQYEYSSGFVLGESSHNGLGFSEEPESTPGVTELSSGMVDDEEQLHRGLGFRDELKPTAGGVVLSSVIVQEGEYPTYDSSSHEIEEDADEDSMDEDDSRLDQDVLYETSSPEKNSAFVSIGGIKLYTQDISDGESDEDEDDDEEEDSSDNGSATESSESDDSEDTSDFDSDIDEDIMEDYLEGIGGCSQVLNSKWLALQDLDGQVASDDSDDDSSDEYEGTLKKLSGVALQEASREYGKQKRKAKKIPSAESHKSKAAAVGWSPSLDDLMLVKDPRRLSAKKKHVARFPQSWPSEGRKSKKFGRYPGEKKKHRKEMIAVKRRERMLRRGVDLEQINLKLKHMVLNNIDMLAFQPMHSRDCSQVQRLATIYGLKSGSQGSGKKRFVTVTRTHHTSMPSASDEVRIEKLIGATKDDTDYPVVDTPRKVRSGPAQSKSAKNSATRQVSSSGKSERKRSGKKAPATYADQPVSFVSSGVIQSEVTQDNAGVEPKDNPIPDSKPTGPTASTSASFGSFEVHTKGFGSKMMAKMGYVEGEGLGRDGKGMSQPIEVTQRPKSLGLGMTFVETTSSSEPVKVAKRSGGPGPPRNGTLSIGAFEKHTKGFGSKMMAKMGFVEGMGLGRDSQGRATPLVAVRRPRARGLGAEGKRL